MAQIIPFLASSPLTVWHRSSALGLWIQRDVGSNPSSPNYISCVVLGNGQNPNGPVSGSVKQGGK